MKKFRIDGFLPVFDGFYNTIFESLDETLFDYDDREAVTDNSFFSDFYQSFKKDAVKSIFETVKDELKYLNLIDGLEFERLASPKEYNYNNDSINCKYAISEANLVNIYKYIKNNKKAFKEYLKKKYTSCSGYWSSYSNKIKNWMSKDIIKDDHKLSSVLKFILVNSGYNDLALYYDVNNNLALSDKTLELVDKIENDIAN